MRNRTERSLRILAIGVCMAFVCLWTLVPFFWPGLTNSFVDMLNRTYENPWAYDLLDGTRVFVSINLGLAMIALVHLVMRCPTRFRYWLFVVPCPWLFTYYLGQLLVDTSDVIPRHGFFVNNVAAGLVFAVVAVLASQVNNMERTKKYGSR